LSFVTFWERVSCLTTMSLRARDFLTRKELQHGIRCTGVSQVKSRVILAG